MNLLIIFLGLFILYVPVKKLYDKFNKSDLKSALDQSDPKSLISTINWFLAELDDSKNQELLAFTDHSAHHSFYLELEFFDKTISANIDQHGVVEIIKFTEQDDFPSKSFRHHFKHSQIKYLLPHFESLKIKTEELWGNAKPLAKLNKPTPGADAELEQAPKEDAGE